MWRKQTKIIVDFNKKLKQDFPSLFVGLGISWRDGGIGSINICQGWHKIIYRMAEKITEISKDIKMGHSPKVAQVKEKFGVLRIYIDYDNIGEEFDREMREIIIEAEKESRYTCEWCGDSGYTKSHCGWLKTLCDNCHIERAIQRPEV